MPIACSEKEWARIKKGTATEKEEPETARRQEYVKYLNAKSQEMIKLWPNSAKNINKRNEEQRLARIAAVEQANTTFYKRYLKQKMRDHDKLKYSAEDFMFKSRDAPKLLLSAVIETAVQKERMEQIEFLKERRREVAENKRKVDNQIIQQAKEWNELTAQRRQKRFEANKLHQQAILQQAHEVAEQNRTNYETEHLLQKIDNMKADEEVKALREFDHNFLEREKLRVFNDMKQAKADCDARKREQCARDKMDERLMAVLNNSRAHVERRRKLQELHMKNERLRVLEAIGAKLETGEAEREAEEQAMLQKAIAEKKAIEDARVEAEWRRSKQLKRERVAAREQFLRDEEQRLHEFHVRRQFEIMNRLKNAELFEDFKDVERQDKARRAKEYRDDILTLWKERSDREARELAESRHFHGARVQGKIRDDNDHTLAHAAHLIEEARQLGRPDYALRRTVQKYCKLHGLHPIPQLNQPAAACDSAQPDASYPGSKDHQTENTGKMDQHHFQQKPGNQTQMKDIHEGRPSKSASRKLGIGGNEPDRRNGLQRRDSKTTLGLGLLPPVT